MDALNIVATVLGGRLCRACGRGLLATWGQGAGICASPACGIGWSGVTMRTQVKHGPRPGRRRAFRRELHALDGVLFGHLADDVHALWVWREVPVLGRPPPERWQQPREFRTPWRRRNRRAIRQLRAARRLLKSAKGMATPSKSGRLR